MDIKISLKPEKKMLRIKSREAPRQTALREFQDCANLEPLTPNHLLLLKSDPSFPPGLFKREDTYSRRRWKQVQLYLAGYILETLGARVHTYSSSYLISVS